MKKVKLTIIGSGPAGLTAAIYASRGRLAPTMFAGTQAGGQLMYTTELENFPGFPQGINGPDFMIGMRQQAERFGTEIINEDVQALDLSQRPFKIWTHEAKDAEHEWQAEAIIITTGATAILLGIPGEEKFYGRGVSSCAVCDAAFYKDKDTLVVGGGDAAMEDALALTKFAKSVTIAHRKDRFRASKIMQDRVLQHPKIKILWNTELAEVLGQDQVTGVKFKVANQELKSDQLAVDGVFIAIGHRPTTTLFQNQLQADDHGYLLTRQSLSKFGVEMAQAALNSEGVVTFPTMTSVPGVFAGGDVVDIRYKQAITAAGQGAAAALDAERWLEQAQSEQKGI